MVKVAYVPTHLPSYYAEEYDVFQRSISGLENLAEEIGFKLYPCKAVVTREEAKRRADDLASIGIDLVLLQNSSFAMGDVVLEFARHPLRLGLWCTEEPTKTGPIMLNNFVSMNLNAGILTRYLRDNKQPFKWFYGPTEHPWFRDRLRVSMRALAAMKRLANANVALIGGVAPTFFNLVSDERALRARLGTEVVPHELREIIERVKRQSPEAIQEVVKDVTDVAQGRVELSPRDLDTSAAVYLALREFALEHQYDALAVSDWPLFQSELALHPGLAFSWLDEHDRIPVASEGDVLGAVTMLMVNAVSAKQSMLLDINDLDPENESVLMWHCGGSPLHFADERGVRWTNHSTLGRKTPDVHAMGAVADLVFRPQPITVARIAADGEQLFVAEARILSSRYEGFDGSRGWVGEFRMNGERLPLADLVNTIMVEGVEHHFVVGSDHHGDALHELAVWSGVRLINRIPYSHALQQGSWL